MTPTGALRRARQKSAHLSNRKQNKRKLKKLKKALSKLKKIEKPFVVGELVCFVLVNLEVSDNLVKWGTVVDTTHGKKKWNRIYTILTGSGTWKVSHEYLEENYRVRKHED